jgi:hypothetical protein
MNDTRLFSVYPRLQAENDSTYIIIFSMPLNDSTLVAENFTVSGTAGLGAKEFTLSLQDENSVKLIFSDIEALPILSTIIITVKNIISDSGRSIEGISSGSYVVPDLRPIVSGQALYVNNEDGFLLASSTKPGSIYLVKYPGTYNSVFDLDSAVNNSLGKKVNSPTAETTIPIYTIGLPGGYYRYYAVDEEERLSLPCSGLARVNETGPVAILNPTASMSNFAAWYAEGKIYIHPQDHTGMYSLQLFDITGRLLFTKENLIGVQQIAFGNQEGIIIIRNTSSAGVETKKIWIQ